MSDEIKLLIADDHPIFRQGLKQVIETAPDLKVWAEAENGEEALRRIAQYAPELALLDVEMPIMDGFEVMRAVRDRKLPTKIVFLTLYRDEVHFQEALDLGVNGYLIKDSAAAEVVKCIRAVVKGENYISPTLSTYLLKRHRAQTALRQQPGLSALTIAEQRVLQQLADYKTSKEIATALGISVRTAEKHRANICEKLNLYGFHALVKFAVQHKEELT